MEQTFFDKTYLKIVSRIIIIIFNHLAKLNEVKIEPV